TKSKARNREKRSASASSSTSAPSTNGKRIVMWAGTPTAADESCCRRNSRTAGSASGTSTIRAVCRGMLGRVKRALLIVNPYSTQVTGRRVTEVARVLGERTVLTTTFTQGPGHATELAAEASAADVDAIVGFSGDGTYNQALNGADGKTPIAFLPGGATSVFPRALGLPRDPIEAARAGAAAGAGNRPPR